MSQSVEAPASADARFGPEKQDDSTNDNARTSRIPSAILFNELVLAHFRYFALSGRYGEFGGLPAELAPAGNPAAADLQEAENHYRKKLQEFTDSEGEIVAAYWSTKIPSGLVMTTRRRGRILNLLLGPVISVHRATTWLTASDPRVAELLHHCDTLGNKAAEILTHTPKRVAMTWIFSMESYLLAAVEAAMSSERAAASQTNGLPAAHKTGTGSPLNVENGAPAPSDIAVPPVSNAEATDASSTSASDDAKSANGVASTVVGIASSGRLTHDDVVARASTEVVEIEKYYDRAAANAARFLYFKGMLAGAIVAAAGGLLIAFGAGGGFGVIDVSSTSTRFFFSCYAAGGLGAIVSVLTRMRSDRFALDYEVGRMPAFWLGTFRPFLGAVFGLVIYFALQSELLQLQEPAEGKAFFFFTLLAFVAGFSERLTQVILGGAERTVAGTLEQADKATGGTSVTETRPDGTTLTTRKVSRTLY